MVGMDVHKWCRKTCDNFDRKAQKEEWASIVGWQRSHSDANLLVATPKRTLALSKSGHYAILRALAVSKGGNYGILPALALSKSGNYCKLRALALSKSGDYRNVRVLALSKGGNYRKMRALTRSNSGNYHIVRERGRYRRVETIVKR